VERDQLIDGNGKLEISRTLAQTAGPALGGGLIGVVTAPIAILGDAISYLASAAFVVAIRRDEPRPDAHHDEHGRRRGSLAAEVRDGLRYVLGNRFLRGIAACTGTANFFNNVALATFIVYAVRELGLDAAVIGIVLGVGNIGALVGAVTADRIRRAVGLGPAIVGSAALNAPGLALLALAPAAAPIPFLIVSGLLSGFSIVVYNINQVSFRQAITPGPMQGRMNATMRFIVWGTIPIGQLVGGVIATTLSIPTALWIGAIGTALAVIPLIVTPVHTLREMPEPLEEDGPSVAAA
jgi:hypothetical protein